MLPTTRDAIGAMLKADPTLDPAARASIMGNLRNAGREQSPTPTAPRLLKRRDVAQALGVSVRAVDLYARRKILRRVILPGNVRAAGFRESDVRALIEAGA